MRSFLSMCILISSLSHGLWGQSYASWQCSKDTITIGDPVTIYLTVFLDGNDRPVLNFSDFQQTPNLLYERDTVNFSPFADLQILQGGKIGLTDRVQKIATENLEFSASTSGNLYKDSIRLTIFDVGIFSIPSPQPINPKGKWIDPQDPIIAVVLPDEIQKALQDSMGMAPIKPIIVEPLAIEDFKYELLILGLILLFTGIIYLLRKRRKKDTHIQSEPEVVIPAHIIAKEKLDQLKAKKLWQKGEIKAYQSELTYIVREYLENRFHIKALEFTTGEILRDIPARVNRENLQQILQIADLVKFAKANPPEDLHSRFMDMAYQLVEESMVEVIDEEND